MLNPLILEGEALARYYTPRDETETHLLDEFRKTVAALDEADSLAAAGREDLTEQLESLRNVLLGFNLPVGCDDLHLALQNPDVLAHLLSEALAK